MVRKHPITGWGVLRMTGYTTCLRPSGQSLVSTAVLDIFRVQTGPPVLNCNHVAYNDQGQDLSIVFSLRHHKPFPVLGGFWVNIRCNCWFCDSFFVCTTKERNTQEKKTNSVVGKINNLKKQEGKKITKVQGLY